MSLASLVESSSVDVFFFFLLLFSFLRLPVLQSDNVDVNKAKPEQLLTAESLAVKENISETRIIDATDSGTCDLEDTSLNSEMFKRKSQGADSVSKGPRTNQTIASRRADGTQTTGNESKSLSAAPVTKTKKVPVKSIEVKTQSDATSQRPPDKNDGGPSTATSPKSKIPVRSTSSTEVKSPVAPVTEVSGTVVEFKSQKKTDAKKEVRTVNGGQDFLKPVNGQSAAKTRDTREASPTKTATKTGTKHIKEKSEVGSHPVNLVNGLVKDGAEVTVKLTLPPEKKDVQKNPDSSDASSTPNSRLPVSVQARKKNHDIAEANRTDSSAVPETERSEAEQRPSADRGDTSLGETRTTDSSPTIPESSQKGKAST